MKLLIVGTSLFLLAFCNGCYTPIKNHQTLAKSTTFGLQLDWPATSSYPSLKVGLIRDLYLVNPTSIVPVYTAPITSSVDTDLNLFHQSAKETIDTK